MHWSGFKTSADFIQVPAVRYLILARLNQVYLLALPAHISTLAPAHGLEHSLVEVVYIDGVFQLGGVGYFAF